MIRCDLEEISQYSCLVPDEPGLKKKRGRYHGTMFWDVPGYGTSKWVIAARIIPLAEVSEIADTDLIQMCLEYINTPPPRKKYQKKKPKPKYGNLELYRARVKKLKGRTVISALLITDERNNKNFWGKGTIVKSR